MPSSASHLGSILLALAGYTFWVFADTSLKIAGASTLPPYEVIALVGLCIAGMMLLPRLAPRAGAPWSAQEVQSRLRALWPRDPVRQFLRSLLELANGAGVVVALQHLPLALFYILIFVSPMTVTLMEALFLREPLTPKKVGAVLAGFLGVVVAVGPVRGGPAGSWAGYAACTVCVLAFSTNMVWSRVMTQTESPASLTFFSGLATGVLGLLAMCWHAAWPTAGLLGVAAAAAAFCVAGNLCFFGALRRIAAATVAQYHYSQFVIGALLAYLIWHERLSSRMLLGAAMIVAAGVFTAANAHGADAAPLSAATEAGWTP